MVSITAFNKGCVVIDPVSSGAISIGELHGLGALRPHLSGQIAVRVDRHGIAGAISQRAIVPDRDTALLHARVGGLVEIDPGKTCIFPNFGQSQALYQRLI